MAFCGTLRHLSVKQTTVFSLIDICLLKLHSIYTAINIFTIMMDQMTMCNAHSDKPTENYHPTVQFSSALWKFFSVFQTFWFWFTLTALNNFVFSSRRRRFSKFKVSGELANTAEHLAATVPGMSLRS